MALHLPLLAAGFIAGKLLKPLLFRSLAALGIGLISYQGLDLLSEQLISLLLDHLSGIPADLLNGMGFARLDTYITITLSAYIGAITFKTISKIIGVR